MYIERVYVEYRVHIENDLSFTVLALDLPAFQFLVGVGSVNILWGSFSFSPVKWRTKLFAESKLFSGTPSTRSQLRLEYYSWVSTELWIIATAPFKFVYSSLTLLIRFWFGDSICRDSRIYFIAGFFPLTLPWSSEPVYWSDFCRITCNMTVDYVNCLSLWLYDYWMNFKR